MNIELSQITDVIWDNDLSAFMFSTESGNINCFDQGLQRIFFYENPDRNPISCILFDLENDSIIFGTKNGLQIYN